MLYCFYYSRISLRPELDNKLKNCATPRNFDLGEEIRLAENSYLLAISQLPVEKYTHNPVSHLNAFCTFSLSFQHGS